jgi:hypothetical protein
MENDPVGDPSAKLVSVRLAWFRGSVALAVDLYAEAFSAWKNINNKIPNFDYEPLRHPLRTP